MRSQSYARDRELGYISVNPREGGRGNGRAMSGLSCLVHQNADPQGEDIIQICHASVGILMECLPEGRWFSRGRSPRENHPPEGGGGGRGKERKLIKNVPPPPSSHNSEFGGRGYDYSNFTSLQNYIID